MKEEWRDISEYEGLYQVSSLGRVKSLTRQIVHKNGKKFTIKGKILKHGKDGGGYHYVNLYRHKTPKNKKVHALVSQSFMGHTSNNKYNLIVDHKNNNKNNNELENLQLITQRENTSKDKKGSSKYTGVCWNKHAKKFDSRIRIERKLIFLGYFEDDYEANLEYKRALKEYSVYGKVTRHFIKKGKKVFDFNRTKVVERIKV